MDFETFKESIKNAIKDYLPEAYQDAQVEIRDNAKINETYTGLFVQRADSVITPTINLDAFYEQFSEHDMMSMSDILEQMADMIQQTAPEIDVQKLTNYEQAKESLFIRVCAIQGNEQMLAQVPHERHEDLAVTYHIAADIGSDGVASTIVSNALLNQFGIDQEQLNADAIANSPKIFPARIESMANMMRRIMAEDMQAQGIPQDQMDAMLDSMIPADDSNPMTVVTNDRTVNGAAVMFYPEQMEQLGDMMHGDFFILPSSVHEILIIPDTGDFHHEELKAMVTEINATQVAPADRLTDEVYHFDTKDKVFEKAKTFEDRQKQKEKAQKMEVGSGKKDQQQMGGQKPKKHKSNDMSL